MIVFFLLETTTPCFIHPVPFYTAFVLQFPFWPFSIANNRRPHLLPTKFRPLHVNWTSIFDRIIKCMFLLASRLQPFWGENTQIRARLLSNVFCDMSTGVQSSKSQCYFTELTMTSWGHLHKTALDFTNLSYGFVAISSRHIIIS
jgi:hypothetical protein